MRGSSVGALSRDYIHSPITESLWYGVTESEGICMAQMMHAVMVAAMYGNPDADLEDGNGKIHEMYLKALHSRPYFKSATSKRSSDVDALIEEWKRMNEKASDEEGTADAANP